MVSVRKGHKDKATKRHFCTAIIPVRIKILIFFLYCVDAEAATGGVLLKNVSWKFHNIHRKTLGPESTLLKKRPWHRCFSMNFAKFLRTPFLQNTSGRLLLWMICLKREATIGLVDYFKSFN